MNGRRETGEVPVRANQHRKLIKARVEKMQREVFQDTRFMVNDPKPEPDAGKLARPVPTSSGCGYPLTLEGEGARYRPLACRASTSLSLDEPGLDVQVRLGLK
jgi:hypothetical protein